MHKIRTKSICPIVIFSLSLGIYMRAQTFPAPPAHSTWDGDILVTTSSDSSTFRIDPLTPGSASKLFKGPSGLRGALWKDGCGWGLTVRKRDGIEGGSELTLHRYSPEGGWHMHGSMAKDRGSWDIVLPASLAPLDQADCFLGTADSGYFFKEGARYSPLAVFRLKEGKLTQDRLIELPTEKPLFQEVLVQPGSGTIKPAKAARWSKDFSAISSALLPTPLVLSDYYVYPWFRSGWFWILSARNGSVRRLVKLYDSIQERDLSRSGEMEMAVLGVQPTRNGLLLVCAREETAVLGAMRAFDAQLTLDRFKAGMADEIRKRQETALRAFPLIQWMHIEPNTGKRYEVARPLNTPGQINSLDQLEQFRFRFKPDGNLDLSFNESVVFAEPAADHPHPVNTKPGR